MEKQHIPLEQPLKQFIDWEYNAGCIASDRITVDGCKVGYMTRSEPLANGPDCGWRFWAGDEDDAYTDDTSHFAVFHTNTICNYDPDIVPFLEAPCGSEFVRDEAAVAHFAPDNELAFAWLVETNIDLLERVGEAAPKKPRGLFRGLFRS